MSSPIDVHARVQLSFKCEGELECYEDEIHRKVVEAFARKKRAGGLREWLTTVTYEALKKEVELQSVRPVQQLVQQPMQQQGQGSDYWADDDMGDVDGYISIEGGGPEKKEAPMPRGMSSLIMKV